MFILLQANFGYFETYANKRGREILKKINTRAAHWVTCRCFSVTRLDQTRRRAWRHRSIIVMTQMSHYQWQMWRATGYLFTSIGCICSLKITCLLLHRIVTKKNGTLLRPRHESSSGSSRSKILTWVSDLSKMVRSWGWEGRFFNLKISWTYMKSCEIMNGIVMNCGHSLIVFGRSWSFQCLTCRIMIVVGLVS